jgi:hypothetical protein
VRRGIPVRPELKARKVPPVSLDQPARLASRVRKGFQVRRELQARLVRLDQLARKAKPEPVVRPERRVSKAPRVRRERVV